MTRRTEIMELSMEIATTKQDTSIDDMTKAILIAAYQRRIDQVIAQAPTCAGCGNTLTCMRCDHKYVANAQVRSAIDAFARQMSDALQILSTVAIDDA